MRHRSTPTGFPDASNTGVPAGTTLTAYTGPSNITTANTVIDGKNIGCIQVTAPGVVIRNSNISCSGGYAVYVDDRTSTQTLVTIEDSEIDCRTRPGTAVGEADVTVPPVNIHGCENGFDANQNITGRGLLHPRPVHRRRRTHGWHAVRQATGTAVATWRAPSTSRSATTPSTAWAPVTGHSARRQSSRTVVGDTNILIENNLLGGRRLHAVLRAGRQGHELPGAQQPLHDGASSRRSAGTAPRRTAPMRRSPATSTTRQDCQWARARRVPRARRWESTS